MTVAADSPCPSREARYSPTSAFEKFGVESEVRIQVKRRNCSEIIDGEPYAHLAQAVQG